MHLKRMLRNPGLAVVASLSYGMAAYADSTITGTVVSAETQAPLPDVVVTATSPALQGEQVVVTDAQGRYRILELPPGVYTLRFDKESFKPFWRTELQVRPEQLTQADAALFEDGEPIVFGSFPPIIDIGSTATRMELHQDVLLHLAVNPPTGPGGAARSFDTLAELVPGAQSDAYGVSLNGATPFENVYTVDGLATQDPVFGGNALPLSVEFLGDIEVITGGYTPEYGRASGGIIRADTRMGSNEFHGTVFGQWMPGTLAAAPSPVPGQASTITGQNAPGNLGDFGATLGGPLVKDKLWFFAGVAPVLTRIEHTRTLNALARAENGLPQRDPETLFLRSTPIPGTSRTFFADERSLQAIGKLTYLFSPEQNLSLAVITTPTRSGGAGRLTVDPRTGSVQARIDAHPDAAGLRQLDNNFTTATLEYNGAFLDKRLLVEAHLGWSRQTVSSLPVDGSGDALGMPEGDAQVLSGNGLAGRSRVTYRSKRPINLLEDVPDAARYCGTTAYEQLLFCPVQGYDIGGIGPMFINSLDRYQAKAQATLLLDLAGSHVLKAGVDAELLSYDQLRASSGGVRFIESTDASYWWDADRYGYLATPNTPVTLASEHFRTGGTLLGGFVQDSWYFAKRFTVNAGLRYDTQSLYASNGEPALQLAHQLSPRVGLVVDPLSNGRMKLFAHYAKYHAQVPLAVLDRIAPAEHRYTALRAATGSDGTGCDPSTLEGQRTGCADPANVLPFGPGESPLYSYQAPRRQFVDPLLAPQASSELVTGAELEVLGNTRLMATYTHRNLDSAIEDMSRDAGGNYFLGNPGVELARDFQKPERTYDAVTVALNHDFSQGWLAQASYTWSRLYGNYIGLVQGQAGQQEPGVLADFDFPSLMENRTGLLPLDRTHSIKVFGAKEFRLARNLSANLGLSYRGQSGTPINYLGGHPILGEGETFVLPRGSAERTPWVHSIDSNTGVTWRLGRRTVTFTLDVFNLFNFQEVTRVDENYTTAAVLPIQREVEPGTLSPDMVTTTRGASLAASQLNPAFKRPIQYQAPRQVRFGIRYAF